MSFDINMNMAGLLPSQGGGGQFPATSLDGTDGPMFHRCAIKSGEKKVNSKNSGEIVTFVLEGRSKEVAGLTHKMTINSAHTDPEVAKRGASDMLAVVYAALGTTSIGSASALFGREIGVVIKLDSQNKPDENYTRVDHVVFADGRPLVVNGQLQPFQVQAGSFGGNGGQQQQQGGQGGGFQSGGQQQGGQTQQFQAGGQQQQQDPNAGQAGGQGGASGFQSGAQVQQTGGFQSGAMARPADGQQQQQQDPNAGQGQQQQGQYQSPGQYQGGQQQGQASDKPAWS